MAELLKLFLKSSSATYSSFHIDKVDKNPAILHADGSCCGYENAKHAVAQDLEHILRSQTVQQESVTYSIHHSDINGLSRLESYIIGLEIGRYFGRSYLADSLPFASLFSCTHDPVSRSFAWLMPLVVHGPRHSCV